MYEDNYMHQRRRLIFLFNDGLVKVNNSHKIATCADIEINAYDASFEQIT